MNYIIIAEKVETVKIGQDDIIIPLSLSFIPFHIYDQFSSNILNLEHILTHPHICELGCQAKKLMNDFLSAACVDNYIDGVPWPEIFANDNIFFFFWNLLIADDLAKRLKKENPEKIIWIGKKTAPYESAFTFNSILTEKFPKQFVYSQKNQYAILKKILSKILSIGRHINKKFIKKNLQPINSCKIAVFFCFNEWAKFTEPVEDMKQCFGNDLAVFYLGSDDSPIYQWAKKNNIRVHKIIYPTSIDKDIKSYFASQKQKWLSKGRYELVKYTGCDIIKSSAILPFFHNFYDYSMPVTAQFGRNIKKIFKKANPSLVIGSSAYTKDGLLPYYMAKAVNIPSMALSHTYVSGDLRRVPADYFTCRNLFERKHYRKTFIDNNRVIYCKNSINRLSYNYGKSSRQANYEYISILVTETGSSNLLVPLCDQLSVIKTLQSLCLPPSDFDNIKFIFKSHPRFDLSPIINTLNKNKNVSVVSASASIDEIVKNAKINIVCNHYGGEIAECIIAEKPIIFLDTAGFCYPDLKKTGYKAGIIINDMEEFWNTLLRLLKDHKFYDKMVERCKIFKNKYFTEANDYISCKIKKLI